MGSLKFSTHMEGYEGIINALSDTCTEAQHKLAIQVESDTDPFVPMRTGSLSIRTRVIDNVIIYPGPYAHYLYEGVMYVDPVTKAAGFKTKDDQWRSKKGVTKEKTAKPLNISKSTHKQATSRWFEASKTQNLEKWEKFAAKEITHDFKK